MITKNREGEKYVKKITALFIVSVLLLACMPGVSTKAYEKTINDSYIINDNFEINEINFMDEQADDKFSQHEKPLYTDNNGNPLPDDFFQLDELYISIEDMPTAL